MGLKPCAAEDGPQKCIGRERGIFGCSYVFWCVKVVVTRCATSGRACYEDSAWIFVWVWVGLPRYVNSVSNKSCPVEKGQCLGLGTWVRGTSRADESSGMEVVQKERQSHGRRARIQASKRGTIQLSYFKQFQVKYWCISYTWNQCFCDLVLGYVESVFKGLQRIVQMACGDVC